MRSLRQLRVFIVFKGEQIWECRLGFNALLFALDPFKSNQALCTRLNAFIISVSKRIFS